MRYWVFMNGEVPGAYETHELAALPGFGMTALVCPASGEIAEKNWRRAGEFADIAAAVNARERNAAPPPPSPAQASAADVDAMIDNASTKLFSHVADLMKELETRREEKGLIVALQRQLAALKEELGRARERADLLEMRLPRIAELEEAQRKDQAALSTAQISLAARDQALNEARIGAEKLRGELDGARRRLQETANDLAMRNRLVDRLSKELSEKELSLAKSLGVIRRFEEDLHRLCPDPAMIAGLSAAIAAAPPAPRPAPPPAPQPAPAPVEAAPVPLPELPSVFDAPAPPAAKAPPSASYTLDEPPPTPPYLEPPPPGERPRAHEALVGLIKRIFPGRPH